MAGWEVAIDRFHNPGLLSAAAGMILFKTVAKRNGGNGGNGS